MNGITCFQSTIDIIKQHNLHGTYAYVDNIVVAGKTKLEHNENLVKFQEAAQFHNFTFNKNKSTISTKSIDFLGYKITHGSLKPDFETDASNTAIAATLNQASHPVAFFSRTFTPTECKHSAVEKEACAIVESFYKPHQTPLINVMQAFECLRLDFKGPLPLNSRNHYMLTLVDEYSHFPFAFACQNMTTGTIT
ncbi:uncharacterized protein LOC143041669 [Oratosquilla oratoria]|uniref:uncharacterized protein LOC143041669 n=1 Tax=Oratosquilla oratoria TaxID=337810 RepID=UPI003F764A04